MQAITAHRQTVADVLEQPGGQRIAHAAVPPADRTRPGSRERVEHLLGCAAEDAPPRPQRPQPEVDGLVEAPLVRHGGEHGSPEAPAASAGSTPQPRTTTPTGPEADTSTTVRAAEA